MPPTEAGAYLLDYLFEVGPVMAGGMGHAPLTFQELTAWQERIGIRLSPWEARTLRLLSMAYISASHEAEARDCPPPWIPKRMSEQQREIVSRKIESALGARAKAKR